jgi:hypothetical protein
MRRDTKIMYGAIMVITTIVVIGSFFAVLQFQYADDQSQTSVTPNTSVVNDAIDAELVVVHQGVPVSVDRFQITLELVNHDKINEAAVATDITIITVATPTPTLLHFTGIGESQTTVDNYTVRLVNATDSTAQILVGQ